MYQQHHHKNTIEPLFYSNIMLKELLIFPTIEKACQIRSKFFILMNYSRMLYRCEKHKNKFGLYCPRYRAYTHYSYYNALYIQTTGRHIHTKPNYKFYYEIKYLQ